MRYTAKAVIGANYGDEGKGLMTDYHIAPAGKDGIVVRFNGGAQAGHTVTTPDGLRHVFSHFGSGTLAGAATFLSRHFVCHPSLFLKEAHALTAAGVALPPVFVDERAPVSTLYDILLNQVVERHRGAGRHGSCGMGFGETIERNLDPAFALSVGDLRQGSAYLLNRLAAIRADYVPRRLAALGIAALDAQDAEWLASDEALQGYVHAAMQFRRATRCARPEVLNAYKQVVFEGAQGLLLDQERGAFPYVTRSHTGIRNALEVAGEAGIGTLDITYVTRAYLTRHGAGPLAGELPGKPHAGIEDPTNVANEFQGTLRFAHLDLDLLVQTIRADFADALACPGVRATLNLAVSCLDQVGPAVSFVEDGRLRSAAPDALAAHLARRLDAGVLYTAWGPSRATVRASARDTAFVSSITTSTHNKDVPESLVF
ncbi:adenylosuccinate synthetase [Massilia sp. IC2-278]|uniref:adenylosuccinate synthetase n=1 Tax=Massilia sp. IC2-278 TaxID=2887200 RepID=UPI001E48BBB5|nr:adenylosuccinate synthetase [Massilia sp. IC2-278]MCC2960575.1 adenylosuccinate synthetase [Massilia sp. IC2-278]